MLNGRASMKRLGSALLRVAGIGLLASVPAEADAIWYFNSNTSADSSWTLGGLPMTFALNTTLTSVQLNADSPNTSITGGGIAWTTGAGLPLLPSLITFASGGTVSVTGDLGDGNGLVSLFSGTFENGGLTLLSGGAPEQSAFSASFVAGSINPALYAFLGVPGLSPNVFGTLTATLNSGFTMLGGTGTVAGVAISLDPPVEAPEPSLLVLLGVGFLAL